MMDKLLLKLKEKSSDDDSEIEERPQSDVQNTSSNYWTKRVKGVEGCKNCTELLIKIVSAETMQEMLNNKNNSEKSVWTDVAKRMSSHGYKVPGKTLEDQGEKAYKKWKNIEEMYIKFLNYVKSTNNTSVKVAPPYFELMHKVLGNKYAKNLIDTSPLNNENERSNSPYSEADESVEDPSEMSFGQEYSEQEEVEDEEDRTNSPAAMNVNIKDSFIDEIKNIIVEQGEREREVRKRHHEEIKELIEIQMRQRDDMISILRQLLEEPDGKKKKTDSE